MNSIGFATLQVIPSLRGLDRAVTSQLGGPMASAGRAAGQRASQGFASSLANGVANAGRAVSRTLQTGLTVGAVAAGGFAASAFVKGFGRLTTIENATSSLTVQLGDARKASKLLNDVLGVVKGTPFNLDQFADAAANLVSMGVEAQKVPGYLRAIGEASATKGKRANEFAARLANVFGTVSAQGRIMGGDINEIAATGVNALAILANHFGVTTDKMREMVSDGAVPATVALDVLSKGIVSGSTGIAGSTVALGGTMEGLRKTLTGSLGGLGAATARIGAAFLKPFSGALTSAFGSATDLIDKLTPRVSALAETIAGSAGFQKFTDFITGLPDKIGNAIGSFKGIATGLAPVAGLLAGLASTKLGGLLGPLGALVPALGPIQGALLGLVATSPQLREALGGVVSAAKPLLETFGQLASTILEALAPVVTSLAATLVPVLKPIVAALAQVAEAVGGAVVLALKQMAPAVVGLVRALVPVLPIIAQLAADLITGLAPVLPRLAKAFSDLVVAVTPLLPPLLNLAVLLVEKIGIPTIVALAVALGAVATAITPLLTNTKVLTPLVFGLAGAFAAFKGVQAVQAGILGIAKAGGTAVGTFQRLAGNASKFFDSVRGGAGAVAKVAKGIVDFGKSALLGAVNVARQTAAFVAQKVAMLAAAVAQKAMAAAQWLLNAAMAANPIGLIVAGIAALVVGAVLLYKKFKPVRAVVDAVGRAFATVARVVTGALKGAFEWIKSNWPKLLLILAGPVGLAVLAWVKFGPKILSAVTTAFSAVVSFFAGLPGKIISALGAIGSLLVDVGRRILGGLLTGAKAVLGVYLAFYVKLPIKILSLLAGAASWLLNVGKRVIGGFLRGLVNGAVAVFQWVARLELRILGALGAVASWLLGAGVKVIGGLLRGIVNGAVAVFGFFAGLPLRIVEFFKGAGRWLLDIGKSILIGLGDGIVNGAGAVLGWLGGLKDMILGAIGDGGRWLFDVGKKIIGGLLDGIKDGIGALKDTLTGLPGKIVSWKGPPAKDAKLLIPTGGIIMEGLIKGLAAELPALKQQLGVVTRAFSANAIGPVKIGADFKPARQPFVSDTRVSDLAATRPLAAQAPPQLVFTGNVYGMADFERHTLEMLRKHNGNNPHAPFTR